MTVREFEIQFNLLYMPLGMYALRIVGDVDMAEDVVQEAFAAAWERIGSGVEIENLKAYMYRAVRNEALRCVRANAGDSSSVDCGDVDISEDEVDTSERDARLWMAIDRLPQRCREVFLMSKRDGFSNAEIAEELGISVKTVENQMTKAYKALRDSLVPQGRKVFFLPFL